MITSCILGKRIVAGLGGTMFGYEYCGEEDSGILHIPPKIIVTVLDTTVTILLCYCIGQ